MKLVAFNFNKISIEKFKDSLEGVKINTSVETIDVQKVNQDIFNTKEEFVIIKFSQTIDYDPKIAKIEIIGNMVISLDSKTLNEVLDKWKNKELPEEFKIGILNIIIKKSSLKALELEEELNLPLHLPLISLKKEDIKEVDKK